MGLFARELKRSGLPPNTIDAAYAGLLGGLLGAKLLWVAEHFGEETLTALLWSRGGMSWFGGFAGGFGAGLALLRTYGLPVVPAVAAATPALAIGHGIGRIGCFMVGDDYGSASDLPWAVAFPEGYPPTSDRVHPTQIYEALPLFAIAALLMRWRRQRRSDHFVLGSYLLLTGLLRFAIEFVRVNERVIGPLTVAHLAALAGAAAGAALLVSARRSAIIPTA